MKIAIVSPFNPRELSSYYYKKDNVIDTGIKASSVHAYVHGLLQLGHSVTVFTYTTGYDGRTVEYTGNNIRVFLLCLKRSYLRTYSAYKLREIIRPHANEFDVIHAEWTYDYAYSVIPFAKKVPTFCSVRDWYPYLKSLSTGVCSKINMSILGFYFKKVMRENNIIKISNSSYTSQMLRDYLGKDNIPLIPNPVKSDLIISQRKSPISERIVFTSIAISLSDSRKNIRKLILAFEKFHAKYSNSELNLIGGDFDTLKNEFCSEKNEGLNFYGQLSHDKVIEELDNSTAMIHPSLEETFGNIFLEASARCIPTIGGYKSGAVPQVLEYGRSGILCDVEDENSIFNAMCLVVEDPDYVDIITKRASLNIKNIYANENICKLHINLFEGVSQL